MTYVSYTDPLLASIEPPRQRTRAKTDWRYLELAVPHEVEVPMPGKVVELLAGIS